MAAITPQPCRRDARPKLELRKAAVSNFGDLTQGSIISGIHGDEDTITALTDDGIEELTLMFFRLKPGTTSSTTSNAARIQTPSPASKRNLRGKNRSVTLKLSSTAREA